MLCALNTKCKACLIRAVYPAAGDLCGGNVLLASSTCVPHGFTVKVADFVRCCSHAPFTPLRLWYRVSPQPVTTRHWPAIDCRTCAMSAKADPPCVGESGPCDGCRDWRGRWTSRRVCRRPRTGQWWSPPSTCLLYVRQRVRLPAA